MITNDRGNPNFDLYKEEPWKTIFLPPKNYYTDKTILREILTDIQPDIVHINEPEHILSTIAPLTISLNTPLVFETFDITDSASFLQEVSSSIADQRPIQFNDNSYNHNKPIQSAGRIADGLLCLTKMTSDKLISMGIDKEKIQILPTSFPRSYSNYSLSNTKVKNLFFIGNLYYAPNEIATKILVNNVLHKVRSVHQDARLTIVGDGPEKLLCELRENGAICVGSVENLNKILEEATIMTCPLFAGNDPKTKIILSLSVGIPIITTSYGASGFTNPECLIVEDNLDRFSETIIDLLNNPLNLLDISNKCTSMFYENHSIDNNLPVLVDFYTYLLNTRSNASQVEKQEVYENEIKNIDLSRWYGDNYRPLWLEEEYKKGRYQDNVFDKSMLRVVDRSGIFIVKELE
jgi:glycosyltransferase involved in cell wall biosynthesis